MRGITLVQYLNVYRKNGVKSYSNDDFGVGTDGIYSFDDALEDAYTQCAKGKAEYVCTLSNTHEDVTPKMQGRLDSLTRAYQKVAGARHDADDYTSDDIEDVAEELSFTGGKIRTEREMYGTYV